MIKIPVLGFHTQDFPPIEHALDDPNGLLAAGGDLSVNTLIKAYSQGIFPWFEDEQPILWWSPSPRAVIFPEHLHISRSLRKELKKQRFSVTMDTAFKRVIQSCSHPRAYSQGTWITQEMIEAYVRLHEAGFAHSVETWLGDKLVGGLYGVALGKLFFGESMFSTETNASKVAFVHLVKQLEQWDYPMIDCQVANDHLTSLGSTDIERPEFKRYLENHIPELNSLRQQRPPKWKLTWKYCPA